MVTLDVPAVTRPQGVSAGPAPSSAGRSALRRAARLLPPRARAALRTRLSKDTRFPGTVAVDEYLSGVLTPDDPVLEAALRTSDAEGLPAIAVSGPHGKLLMLLARLTGARRVLEIGTLGGYSTLWLAQGLPDDGRMVTLEVDPHHARVARANLDRSERGHLVEVRTGAALETLPELAGETFDLVFIDADKDNCPRYLEWALQLTRPGALIIVDNVVRHGQVVRADSGDPSVRGIRRMLEAMAEDPRIDATAIQTVGAKGWDGMAVGLRV